MCIAPVNSGNLSRVRLVEETKNLHSYTASMLILEENMKLLLKNVILRYKVVLI